MPKVFVNGISAKSGGGRSILTNFLRVARRADDEFTFIVAVPSTDSYRDFENERVSLVCLERWSSTYLIPFASFTKLPTLAEKTNCDIVFNLADVPIRTRLPQVLLFDWPYAAFPNSPAWQLSTLRDKAVRRAKLLFFERLLPFADVVIAQNDALADQLNQLYQCKRITVVPNAVSLDNLEGGTDQDFALGSGYKLLCLSRYYSHKNIEVFLPLAERIKAAREEVKIITTIEPDDGHGARRFLAQVDARNLRDVIINLGAVPMEQVPSVYKQTDALILPTFLESFSGTYVEAMHHRKPILTSRLPFAEAVCGDTAYYFDPSDPTEMLDRVRQARDNPNERKLRLDRASLRLGSMPTWLDAYRMFIDVISATLGNRT